MKKKNFKSVISLALSLALAFSATAILSTFTASAENANKKTFNFDETSWTQNMQDGCFDFKNEQNHGDGKGKSLKITRANSSAEKNEVGNPWSVLLTDKNINEGDKYQVTNGETYKVTLYYKTVGTAPSESWVLGIAAGSLTKGGITSQVISSPLKFPIFETDWLKYETTFTANLKDENKNYLRLSVYMPEFSNNSGYNVYIDDVTVEKIDANIARSGTKTFDFGMTKLHETYASTTTFSISKEEHNGTAIEGRSLKIFGESEENIATRYSLLTALDNTSPMVYNVEWGKTYRVTLWYKTVGTAPTDTAWKLKMYTGNNSNFWSGLTEQTLNDSVYFSTTATDGWIQKEVYFTASEKNESRKGNTSVAIGVELPKFSNNTGDNAYAVYLDDITVSEMQAGDVNCDGEINSNDLALLRMALLGIEVKAYNCNVNDDTVVDIRDLVALKKLFTEINQ